MSLPQLNKNIYHHIVPIMGYFVIVTPTTRRPPSSDPFIAHDRNTMRYTLHIMLRPPHG